MKYIKEALLILKTRWPEAAMLIVLAVALGILNMNFFTTEESSASPEPVYALLSLIMMVFFLLFKLGFLSTAHKTKDQHQHPLTLLKEGRRFFWRFALLGILYATVYLVITFAIMPFFAPQDMANAKPETLMPAFEKVMLLDYIIVTLVFMKFIIFLPALVIVNDVTVPLSLGLLKSFKLKEAKGVVVLFLIPVAINATWMLLPDFEMELKYQKIISILPALVNHCLNLIIAVAAIRFVASLDLLYDNENNSEPDLTEGEN